MKCIKALRPGKDVQVGDIKRVDEKTAYNLVGSSWAYVSKTEWKLSRGKKEVNPNHENDRKLIDEAAAVSLNTAKNYQEEMEKNKKSNNKKTKK